MPLKRLRLASETFLFCIGINTHGIKPSLRAHFRALQSIPLRGESCCFISKTFKKNQKNTPKKSENDFSKPIFKILRSNFSIFIGQIFNFRFRQCLTVKEIGYFKRGFCLIVGQNRLYLNISLIADPSFT